MAQSKKKTVGVEALADDIDDEIEDAETEDEDEAIANAKALEAEDDDDDEDEEDDSDDDDDEDEDEVAVDESANKFAPYVFSGEETSWSLGDLFKEVDDGETIYIYDVEGEIFYKLMPIEVGELS